MQTSCPSTWALFLQLYYCKHYSALTPRFSNQTMSLTRQLLREFQPFFSVFDDPFLRSDYSRDYSRDYHYHPYRLHSSGSANQQNRNNSGNNRDGALSLFNQLSSFRTPRHVLEESEDDKAYVVEAELPGVKREDVDVRIGDEGRSISIKGRVVRSSGWGGNNTTSTNNANNNNENATPVDASTQTTQEKPSEPTQEVAKAGSSEVVPAEASQPQQYYEQTFSQTIWLPQAVSPNGEGINAKLEDGVLKLWIPKPEPRDAAGFRIPVA